MTYPKPPERKPDESDEDYFNRLEKHLYEVVAPQMERKLAQSFGSAFKKNPKDYTINIKIDMETESDGWENAFILLLVVDLIALITLTLT